MAERSWIEQVARDVVMALGMGLVDRRVSVGIIRAPDARYDGIFHVRHATGRVKTLKFVVDKPAYLKRPTEACVESIFRQGEAMGMEVLQVELIYNQLHRMYTAGQREPAYVQARYA